MTARTRSEFLPSAAQSSSPLRLSKACIIAELSRPSATEMFSRGLKLSWLARVASGRFPQFDWIAFGIVQAGEPPIGTGDSRMVLDDIAPASSVRATGRTPLQFPACFPCCSHALRFVGPPVAGLRLLLRLFCFLSLSFFGPRWNDANFPCVGDRLSEMLSVMAGDQEKSAADCRLPAWCLDLLLEFGIFDGQDRVPKVRKRILERLNHLCLVAR